MLDWFRTIRAAFYNLCFAFVLFRSLCEMFSIDVIEFSFILCEAWLLCLRLTLLHEFHSMCSLCTLLYRTIIRILFFVISCLCRLVSPSSILVLRWFVRHIIFILCSHDRFLFILPSFCSNKILSLFTFTPYLLYRFQPYLRSPRPTIYPISPPLTLAATPHPAPGTPVTALPNILFDIRQLWWGGLFFHIPKIDILATNIIMFLDHNFFLPSLFFFLIASYQCNFPLISHSFFLILLLQACRTTNTVSRLLNSPLWFIVCLIMFNYHFIICLFYYLLIPLFVLR